MWFLIVPVNHWAVQKIWNDAGQVTISHDAIWWSPWCTGLSNHNAMTQFFGYPHSWRSFRFTRESSRITWESSPAVPKSCVTVDKGFFLVWNHGCVAYTNCRMSGKKNHQQWPYVWLSEGILNWRWKVRAGRPESLIQLQNCWQNMAWYPWRGQFN